NISRAVVQDGEVGEILAEVFEAMFLVFARNHQELAHPIAKLEGVGGRSTHRLHVVTEVTPVQFRIEIRTTVAIDRYGRAESCVDALLCLILLIVRDLHMEIPYPLLYVQSIIVVGPVE